VVFNGTGEREAKLAEASREMVRRFERLLSRILNPPALPPTATIATDNNDDGVAAAVAAATARASTAADDDAAAARAMCSSPLSMGIQTFFARSRRGEANASVVDGGDRGAQRDAYATIAQRLLEFDEAWLQYLDQFAAWKLEDAASLESELVSASPLLPLSAAS
jgi:hypothetical protein